MKNTVYFVASAFSLLACSSGSSDSGVAASAGSAGMLAAAGMSSVIPAAGSGGAPAVGSAGSANGGTATGGNASAGTANGGSPGGGSPSGGSASGGMPSAGSANGGASGGGASGGTSGGSGGASAGGAKSCAGNAVSLSKNGTGSDSDAARARVEIDLGSDLPIGNSPRTVEFWAYIKPTDWIGEKNEVYFYGGAGSTNTAFGLDFGTNLVAGTSDNHATLNPFTNGSFTVDSTDNLGITSTSSQWVHIAMSWNGSAVKTYVNGELRITSVSTTNAIGMLATTSSVFTLGCNPSNNNCFNGSFDELRIWKVERAATDIKASYAKSLTGGETGLVGYWKFDEAPGGTTAADSVTTTGHTAHTGQLLSATAGDQPTFITPNPPAPIGCP